MLSGARAAAALAVALLFPTLSGLAVALLGDRVPVGVDGGEAGDDAAVQRLAVLLGVNAAVTLLCHLAAAAASWSLVRRAPFSSSTLAQPVLVFAALRPLGAALLVGSALVPALREPLLGPALAILDAAFVAALMLVVAPALGARRNRAYLAGFAYAAVRAGSAVAVLSSLDDLAAAALVHRLLALWAAGAVALVLGSLARELEQVGHEAGPRG